MLRQGGARRSQARALRQPGRSFRGVPAGAADAAGGPSRLRGRAGWLRRIRARAAFVDLDREYPFEDVRKVHLAAMPGLKLIVYARGFAGTFSSARERARTTRGWTAPPQRRL